MKTIKITAFLALYIGFIAATKANNLKIENISYEAGISKWSFDLSGGHSWIFSEHKSANPSSLPMNDAKMPVVAEVNNHQ